MPSLVGSEMCIRDRTGTVAGFRSKLPEKRAEKAVETATEAMVKVASKVETAEVKILKKIIPHRHQLNRAKKKQAKHLLPPTARSKSQAVKKAVIKMHVERKTIGSNSSKMKNRISVKKAGHAENQRKNKNILFSKGSETVSNQGFSLFFFGTALYLSSTRQ